MSQLINHFNSLPDDLNNYKLLSSKQNGKNEEDDKINDLTDQKAQFISKKKFKIASFFDENKILHKRSLSQILNEKSKPLIQDPEAQIAVKPLIDFETNKKFKQINMFKKLDSDSDSGLCSATEELNEHHQIVQEVNNEQVDKFNQELISKAQEMSDKYFKKNEELHKPFSKYRSLSIIGKRATTRLKSRPILIRQEESFLKESLTESDFSKRIRFDMPSLTEINELTSTVVTFSNNDQSSDNSQEAVVENTDPVINISNETNTNNTANTILTSLEYLMNNSKSNVFNTTVAIANIAAAASAAASDSNLITNGTETALQNFFMDLVIPNVDSTNDILHNNAADLSMIYQQHLIENSSANFLGGATPGVVDASGTAVLSEINSSNFNLNNTNNKQTNDQIMRTCMGYLDYINKKHNKERRTQIIRNKISGFVLLTLVFLMVFGLAMIMFFCLTNALAKILGKNQEKKPIEETKLIEIRDTKKASGLNSTVYARDRLKYDETTLSVLNTSRSQLALIEMEPIIRNEITIFIENLLQKLVNLDTNLKVRNLTKIKTTMLDLMVLTIDAYTSNDKFAELAEYRYFRYIDEIN